MRMFVTQTHVLMPMAMGFACRIFRSVLMLMMHIVDVVVRMLQWRMFMLVLMPLGELKPDTHGHQDTGSNKMTRDRFM